MVISKEDDERLREIRHSILRAKLDLDVLVKTYWWDTYTPEGEHLQRAAGNLEESVRQITEALTPVPALG